MAKKGRPRKAGKREPNGRLSRAETDRDATATVIAARSRHFNINDKSAGSSLMGYALGRLRHFGMITEAELEAGNRFALDAARYYRLTGIPFPSPRSATMDGSGGKSCFEPDRETVQKAADRWMELYGLIAMNDRPGRPVLETLMNVCVRDVDAGAWPPHMIHFLHKGLCALVVFYGVNTQGVDARDEAA